MQNQVRHAPLPKKQFAGAHTKRAFHVSLGVTDETKGAKTTAEAQQLRGDVGLLGAR